jgi:hypothetical protein
VTGTAGFIVVCLGFVMLVLSAVYGALPDPDDPALHWAERIVAAQQRSALALARPLRQVGVGLVLAGCLVIALALVA